MGLCEIDISPLSFCPVESKVLKEVFIPFLHVGDKLCAQYYVRLSKLSAQFVEGGQVDVESHSASSNEYFRHLILVSTFSNKTHSTAEEGLLASCSQGYVCIYAEIYNRQVSIKAIRLKSQTFATTATSPTNEVLYQKADPLDKALERTRSKEKTAPKTNLNTLLERVILSSFRLRGITRDCMSKKDYADLYSHVYRAAKFAVRDCVKNNQVPSLERLQSVVDDLLNLFHGGG